MRIYFFGGSFDPPHLGHLGIAEYCISKCDKFLFIPAKQSPHKVKTPIASSAERVEMLEIMTKSNSKIKVDRFEIDSIHKNYTINTVKYLEEKYPNSKLTMVIGLDQFKQFSEWYKIEELLKKVAVLCFNRKGNDCCYSEQVKVIPDFNIEISSTEVRRLLIKNDNKAKEYLHPIVYKFIKEEQLYL